jgi:hypothetical protein
LAHKSKIAAAKEELMTGKSSEMVLLIETSPGDAHLLCEAQPWGDSALMLVLLRDGRKS